MFPPCNALLNSRLWGSLFFDSCAARAARIMPNFSGRTSTTNHTPPIMSSWQVLLRPLDSPIKSLLVIFAAWKAVLLLIAVCSPGVGYDTSTSLYHGTQNPQEKFLPAVFSLVSNKLTRWDAIYFTKAANRGYLYEQEWAFGWGMSQLIGFFSKGWTASTQFMVRTNRSRSQRSRL